jgi:hypothetical protein
MILVLFDPRAGKRVAVEIADPGSQPRLGTVRIDPRSLGDGPEDGGQRQHDDEQDEHEAEHAAAPEMLPRKTLEDHGALDRVGE